MKKTVQEYLTPEKVKGVLAAWTADRNLGSKAIEGLSADELNDFISLYRRARNSLEDEGLDASKVPVSLLRDRVAQAAAEIFGGAGALKNPHLVHPEVAPPASRKIKVSREFLGEVIRDVIASRQGLLSEQEIEELNLALQEGRIGDWVSENWSKIKDTWTTLTMAVKSKAADHPLVIGFRKLLNNEEFSEDDKQKFKQALITAGVFALPMGSLLLVLKHLISTQMGGIE